MKGKFLSIGAPFALLAVGVIFIVFGIFLSGGNSSPEELKTPVAEVLTQLPYGEPEGSSIYGTVHKRSEFGNPIANATIRAVNRASGEVTVAQSATDGQYRIPVPSGDYMVSAEAEGYELSFVENVGVHSHALQNIDLVPKGQAAAHSELGNPENYVIRQGVHDAGSAEAVVTAHGYTMTGPAVYTFVSGNGDIAYRDRQAIPTYVGNVNGPAWAVPVAGGVTVYVMVECGNVSKIVVEVVMVIPPPPAPVVSTPIVWTATSEPTSKPAPAICTPTPTCIPQVATATSTPIPTVAPSTPTSVPTATFTPVPTNTPVPPTSTPIPTSTPTFTVTPTATPTRVPPTVWGRIRVEPDSGFGQIMDADVIAEVIGGTATGPITYKFDCTNDGIFEKQVSGINETSYRAVDLCDYPVPNEYITTVRIEREGESGGANAHVWVLPSQ